jgi:tRNA-dihydrouridine synthase
VVTGKGAGSSLLRTPEALAAAVRAMVAAAAPAGVPVTVKMRSGFEDTSLFADNLLAAQVASPPDDAQGCASPGVDGMQFVSGGVGLRCVHCSLNLALPVEHSGR